MSAEATMARGFVLMTPFPVTNGFAGAGGTLQTRSVLNR